MYCNFRDGKWGDRWSEGEYRDRVSSVFHVFVINAHNASEIIVYITIIKQVHLNNLIWWILPENIRDRGRGVFKQRCHLQTRLTIIMIKQFPWSNVREAEYSFKGIASICKSENPAQISAITRNWKRIHLKGTGKVLWYARQFLIGLATYINKHHHPCHTHATLITATSFKLEHHGLVKLIIAASCHTPPSSLLTP